MAAPVLRVVEAHVRTYRHTWQGSVVSTILSPLLYLGAMGLGLGTLVDRGQGPAALAGASYLAFLAPGLLAATTMQTAAGESAWPVMMGMKWARTYLAALATPITSRDLLIGQLVWVAVRVTITAVVFAALMALLGATSPLRAAAALAPAVVSGMAFSGPVMAFTARLETDYALSSLFRFGIMPMFLFSGTFFPTTQLPDALERLVVVIPLWHGVELTRGAAMGTAPALPVAVHLGYLLLWFAVGAVLAERGFRRRLVR
jgi:lipooligosaccharide transport system permease protein